MADEEIIKPSTKKPIEYWLQAKLMELQGLSGLPANKDAQAQEAIMWHNVARTPAIRGWPLGEEMTLAEYEAGIKAGQEHDPHVAALKGAGG